MKNIENQRLFVGGYNDERIFKGDYFNNMKLIENCETFSIEEMLEIHSIKLLVDEYIQYNNVEWDELPFAEKIQDISWLTSFVEGMTFEVFNTEEEAEEFKQNCIKEMDAINERIKNDEIVWVGQEYNHSFHMVDIYALTEELQEA